MVALASHIHRPTSITSRGLNGQSCGVAGGELVPLLQSVFQSAAAAAPGPATFAGATPSGSPDAGTNTVDDEPNAIPERGTLGWFVSLDTYEQRRALYESGFRGPASINGNGLPTIEEVWAYDVDMTLDQFNGAMETVSIVHLNTSAGAREPAKWFLKGAENDARWLTGSLREKALYELGQSGVPNSVFRTLPQGSSFEQVVLRGEKLLERADGNWIRAFAGSSLKQSLKLVGTGPTPAFRFIIMTGAAGAGVCGVNMSCREEAKSKFDDLINPGNQ